MLKIIKSEPKIFLREAAETGNFLRDSFQRVVFEASTGGIELSYSRFDAENAVAVGGDYSVGTELAGVNNILVVYQLFSHLITSFNLISDNIISYFLFRCKTDIGNGEHSEQKHCNRSGNGNGIRLDRHLGEA